MLFLSSWCRKRPTNNSSSLDDDSDAFPQPISSSFTPPSVYASSPIPRQTRQKVHRLPKHRKASMKGEKSDISSMIPIRGAATARPSRLAASAPSTFAPTPSPQASQAALAKMTAGGFRPRQTPARVILNAAAATTKPKDVIDMTNPDTPTSAQRVRKERSESSTPGPGPVASRLLLDNMVPADGVQATANGKRVKT